MALLHARTRLVSASTQSAENRLLTGDERLFLGAPPVLELAFPSHCRGLVSTWLRVDEAHRPPRTRVGRPAPVIVAKQAAFEIIGVAHIVGAVGAPDDLDVVAHLPCTCPSTRYACSLRPSSGPAGHHSTPAPASQSGRYPTLACHEQVLSTAKGASNGGNGGNPRPCGSGRPWPVSPRRGYQKWRLAKDQPEPVFR
jgi:hypothetical protein